jgi:hypothetical protein
VLDQHPSVALLDAALRTARPGDSRISTDRKAASQLAGACGGLPLALQITAALLKADAALTAADLAGELAAESARLERLAYNDGSRTSIAAAFELSYGKLDNNAARLRLPDNPGPDISTAATAVLAKLPMADARRVLAGLAQAHRPSPPLARAGGDDCTTYCACTPSSYRRPTPMLTTERGPATGCFAGTWRWQAPRASIWRRCPAWQCQGSSLAGRCPGVAGRGAGQSRRRGRHGYRDRHGSGRVAAAHGAS